MSLKTIVGVIIALLAIEITLPLAWYVAGIWLDNFAYRITISAHYFVVAGLASLLITAIVIVSQSYREILRNPVEGLKAQGHYNSGVVLVRLSAELF